MYPQNKEQKLISQIKQLIGPGGQFIGDDCAILPGSVLLTTDSLVESTHFRLNWTTLPDLGWKAMAVNLSDIAAMAGIPEYALIALSAPSAFYADEQVLSLYKGLTGCAEEYKTAIVGGNITAADLLSINITIVGRTHPDGVLSRNGAHIDDVIAVTGDFGASAAGLHMLNQGFSDGQFKHCINKHFRPQPRLQESWQLIERSKGQGALMDTSDGLADALAQIAQASNVGMKIDLQAVPIDQATSAYALQANLNQYELALYGGEDYELLACIPPDIWHNWLMEKPESANLFKPIGRVTDTKNIQLTFGNETVNQLDLSQVFQHIS